ncbi:MAG: hypothetical protein KatS3mg105_4405 [Gemmatales bacterium]|nr:MAG: hypothetical protein KatS3mg105_4405 [Gemmatales bacterium]
MEKTHLGTFRRRPVFVARCTLDDLDALQQFSDAVLRRDYFFKKGHWQYLLSSPHLNAVWAIGLGAKGRKESDEPLELVGLFVQHAKSILYNFFLRDDVRGQGLGGMVLQHFQPQTIRAKMDMSTGDPTGFYEKHGYRVAKKVASKGVAGKREQDANIALMVPATTHEHDHG